MSVGTDNLHNKPSSPLSVLDHIHPTIPSMSTNKANGGSQPLLDRPTPLSLPYYIHSKRFTSIPSRRSKKSQDKEPTSLSSNPYTKYYERQTISRHAINSPPLSQLNALYWAQVGLTNQSTTRATSAVKSLRFGDNVTVVFPSPINQTIVVTPPPCKSADAGPTQYDSLVINAAGKDTSPFDAVQPSPIKSPASALLDGNDDESIDLAPEEDERLDYAPNYKMSLHADHRAIILDHTTYDWNVPHPHKCQVQSINGEIFYDDSVIYIAAKTGYGKSLIPLTIASIRKGISISMVSLLGLESDQVSKAMYIKHGAEAYHMNEHWGEGSQSELRNTVKNVNEEELCNVSIILYISPNSLAPNTKWTSVLKGIASCDLVGQICMRCTVSNSTTPPFDRSSRSLSPPSTLSITLQLISQMVSPSHVLQCLLHFGRKTRRRYHNCFLQLRILLSGR